MKFSEFPFYRLEINQLKQSLNILFDDFAKCNTFEEQHRIFIRINDIIIDFYTMDSIAAVRFSTDTTRKNYEEDKEYFDNISPVLRGLELDFYKQLNQSRFLEQYGEKYGAFFIDKIKKELLIFSNEIENETREENSLETEYQILKSRAMVEFEGEELNIAKLVKFQSSTDRAIRKKAYDAVYKFNKSKKDNINNIFDKLIKVRTRAAQKLGFDNYLGFGYARMNKEFSPAKAAKFRSHILKHIAPLAAKLREKQRIRLGFDKLKYYDALIKFKSGNPKPLGSPEWIVEQSVKMFSEISPVTKEFITFMVECELLDLHNRKGKTGGGYSTSFIKYKAPFIFTNMKGTDSDVTVFLHEAGHALQFYLCRDYVTSEERNCTSDVDEVHSISMELLTMNYMDLFFGEDTEKFMYNHLVNSIRSIADNVCGDEFQEIMYLNPELTPEERNKVWLEIRNKYRSGVDYSECDYLMEGNDWQSKALYFSHPLYHIEYALAELVAYQFYFKSKMNFEKTFNEYIEFCKLGGKYTFSESLEKVGLKNPFEEETVIEITKKIEELIDSIDDSKF